MDPNQMSIFDLEQEWGGNEPSPVPYQKGVIKTKEVMQEISKNAIRLNEYHFSNKFVGPEFSAWLIHAKKAIGDYFTIEEVREWYKEKGWNK